MIQRCAEEFFIIQFSLQTRTRFDQVLDALGLSIVAGDYPEGSRLPLEAVLCEELGVSRPVVREAVKALSAKGMISARPRVGLLVEARNHWNLLDPQVLGWLIQSTSRASFDTLLLGVRRVIEPECAAQAAVHASLEQRQALQRAQQELALAATAPEQLEAYLRFHRAMLAAVHNELLAHIGNTLLSAQAEALRVAGAPGQPLAPERHRQLYDAIAGQQPELARSTALTLIQELHPHAQPLPEPRQTTEGISL